ncbi:MAG TPA: 2'-5' RNA ligase family protein [Mycobacteriales bacterium]|nr:2'-5' RNA ligase family protein [Mycobacteriales bacterium]
MTIRSDTATMRDHWWWRPGWRPGRSFYSWHLTFAGQHALYALVDAYQDALRPLPGLDLIPHQWLHLTMQGIGFTDEVSDDQVRQISAAAADRLAAVPAPTLTFHRPAVTAEALPLGPTPAEPVDAIRDAIRAGIADVWGPGGVPEAAGGFRAHVSLAYSSATGPAAPIIEALGRVATEPITVSVRAASLIVVNRDNRMYEWQTYATAPLGP